MKNNFGTLTDRDKTGFWVDSLLEKQIKAITYLPFKNCGIGIREA